MGMQPTNNQGREGAGEFAAVPVLSFFEKHQSALWHAARLLGGYDASRLVDRCAERLEAERAVNPRVRMMLGQLLALLTLEHVHDPDRPQMGFFALIDPCDPVVAEICLLSDGLTDAMAQAEKRRVWAEKQSRFRKAA